jgi:hypothetical protein
MWFHSDTSKCVGDLQARSISDLPRSYGAAMVGVATAKTPCGPYTYKSSFKPLGADSRDESIFQDGASSPGCSARSALTKPGFR